MKRGQRIRKGRLVFGDDFVRRLYNNVAEVN